MVKGLLSSLLIFIGAALTVELISFGFSMMNTKDTFVFYMCLAVAMFGFSIIGVSIYKIVNSILNSSKNK